MEAFKLICPFNAIVCGSSQSGKTTWTRQLLNNLQVLSKPVAEIIWCHGITSENMPESGVTKVSGLPNLDALEHLTRDGRHRLLILDDLLMETMESKDFLPKLFTKYSHHLNLSVIVLTQSLFDVSRTCRISSHYTVLFRNLSDQLNVETLGRQMFGKRTPYFMASFIDATSKQYGYLMICSHPRETNEKYRLLTDIFAVTKVYLPK